MSEGRAGNGQAQPDIPSTTLPRREMPSGQDGATRRLMLPPPYTQAYRDDGDVLDDAVKLAPEEGAGTLVWRKSGGLLAFAVVLEPEKPLREARLAFFAGMAALGDALAAHCVP
ncbi:MAG: biotin/lipoate--protein ligase family protein, partial [Salinarimonas sp.]